MSSVCFETKWDFNIDHELNHFKTIIPHVNMIVVDIIYTS